MKIFVILAVVVTTALCYKIPEDTTQNYKASFPTGRIINGVEADEHAAAYIVSLHQTPKGSHFCAGSIIKPNWIVTAAHCITGGTIYASAGLHDRNIRNPDNTRKAKTAIVHEGYAGGVGPNDIALLELESPFVLDNAKVIQIWPSSIKAPNGLSVKIFGWGKDNTGGGLPNRLQTVTTELLDASTCKRQLPVNAPIAATNVCSSSMGKGISACNGDSGGPLVGRVREGDAVTLIGIVSWGYIPCGQAGYPSIYTDIMSFYRWIEENVGRFNKHTI